MDLFHLLYLELSPFPESTTQLFFFMVVSFPKRGSFLFPSLCHGLRCRPFLWNGVHHICSWTFPNTKQRSLFPQHRTELYFPTSEQYRAKFFLIKKLIPSDFRSLESRCHHFNSLSEVPLWLKGRNGNF